MNRAATSAASPTGDARYAKMTVVILGLARQGIAAARFFLGQGSDVIVSDLRTESELTLARDGLEAFAAQLAVSTARNASLRFALGGHPAKILDGADLLCLSGGVSPAIPIAQEAARRGIPLTNDALLTLNHCPVPVIGVTGSAGKTTTTTLVGLMLEAEGFTVHVGGNIGTPLIDRLDAIRSGDKVVMELSSFQLELFDRSPDIAAVLNITPNHLDRHPSMSHYAAAKANILQYQSPGDACILNADDAYTGAWLRSGRCQIDAGVGQPAVYFPLFAGRLAFSLSDPVTSGAFLSGNALVWRRPGLPDAIICRAGDLQLRGRHNVANILAAACIAGTAGASAAAMRAVATTFGGVEHRLEVVRRRNGVLWINDSIATAPERTAAALRSFEETIILLLGGRDKNLPWDECIAEVVARAGDAPQVRQVILFGEAAGLIQAAFEARRRSHEDPAVPIVACADLEQAVRLAAGAAQSGDVVLLAPGGTSFDAYPDFEARGRHFRALVEALP
jgi:UDP-N-acetylmuramoylalanine--D-glutamate ligase